jgi:hypothetical protein
MQIRYNPKITHNGNATDINGSYLRQYAFQNTITAHGVISERNYRNVIQDMSDVKG